MSEITEVLGAHPMLEACSGEEVAAIASSGSVQEARMGEVLIKEGDAGTFMMLLAEGTVDVSKVGKKHRSHSLATLEPGAMLGEMSLLVDQPRSATVKARQAVSYFKLERDAFLARLDDGCSGARTLLMGVARTMAARQAATDERLLEFLETEDSAPRVDLSKFKSRFRSTMSYHV